MLSNVHILRSKKKAAAKLAAANQAEQEASRHLNETRRTYMTAQEELVAARADVELARTAYTELFET